MFLLPVQFTDMRAKASGNEVEVSWSISTVPDKAQFIIQRSRDGVLFTTIDTVAASTLNSYRYADVSPVEGRSYYRIMLTYTNDHRIATQILPVDVGSAPQKAVALPNPFKTTCTVTLPRYEFVQQVKVVNLAGAVVHIQQVQRETRQITIRPADMLPAGEYFIQVTTNNSAYNLRVVRR